MVCVVSLAIPWYLAMSSLQVTGSICKIVRSTENHFSLRVKRDVPGEKSFPCQEDGGHARSDAVKMEVESEMMEVQKTEVMKSEVPMTEVMKREVQITEVMKGKI
jgi:hypothetical protein